MMEIREDRYIVTTRNLEERVYVARDWEIQEGVLKLRHPDHGTVAMFPAGCWLSVESVGARENG